MRTSSQMDHHYSERGVTVEVSNRICDAVMALVMDPVLFQVNYQVMLQVRDENPVGLTANFNL
jgi:hypothetical protein